MSLSVDLNADMGESLGPWKMGNDAELLKVVTSANIACGFHAGDPDTMAQTMRLAAENGVGIGAHPGFDDLKGFGRYRLNVPLPTLANQVRYQVGAALGMAKSIGVPIRHVKLHGAMSNMSSENQTMARALYEAVLSVDPDITLMVLAGTAQQRAAEEIGCAWAGEIFADRAYNPDGTLVDRSKPGAVLHDPVVAGPRIAAMVKARAILTEDGTRLPTRIDTICLHGDGATAVAMAQAVRQTLEAEGITVRRFPVTGD